ncbi:diaminobutyrate acetyltransferase [Effusibacillus dendaii]|uniref:L-2,4-diaminobutyric acid acetyltransferase n=1 Tax=Effusibacillus dendaii TaxID=2743772 RepID=A0A7I8DD05_9BACL|nr:diaminobutyrate acetyltransferase [Effusibacillus dendaii]BCJ86706.1 L-2,4-diaminobutyric acid acetyltransferase [Effusibacillus dendaii]
MHLTFRNMTEQDGADVWTIVKETGVLDVNSVYAYLMMGKYFPHTCVVAEYNGKICGFITAFLPPGKPDTIFVWQVGVANTQQGKGIGKSLLRFLMTRDVCRGVRFLETTISPSNRPSESLFRGFARDWKTGCRVTECFPVELFLDGAHEAEMLFRIGPFSQLNC